MSVSTYFTASALAPPAATPRATASCARPNRPGRRQSSRLAHIDQSQFGSLWRRPKSVLRGAGLGAVQLRAACCGNGPQNGSSDVRVNNHSSNATGL